MLILVKHFNSLVDSKVRHLLQTVVYHTLEDRENPDYVEDNGPFKCNLTKAYLGPGYYFWDNDLQVAHSWGQHRIKSDYIICKADLDVADEILLDLYYNGGDREFLRTIINRFKLQGKKLGQIISFLQKRNEEAPTKGVFPYKAIRIQDSNFGEKLFFAEGKNGFTSLNPSIMICLVDKSKVHLDGFKIIYPEKYTQ